MFIIKLEKGQIVWKKYNYTLENAKIIRENFKSLQLYIYELH